MFVNMYLTPAERVILERACVGIAGAGGLGSNCAQHLVRAGVRHLVMCDFDVVNASNLNRQFFFQDQIGQLKVKALETNLRRIASDLSLDFHSVRCDENNVKKLFSSCDLVVDAFDSAQAKGMLIRAMRKMGKPLILASGLAGWGDVNALRVQRLHAHLTLVGDGVSEISPTCPPQSPRVGVVAAMQANEVIRYLLSLPIS